MSDADCIFPSEGFPERDSCVLAKYAKMLVFMLVFRRTFPVLVCGAKLKPLKEGWICDPTMPVHVS